MARGFSARESYSGARESEIVRELLSKSDSNPESIAYSIENQILETSKAVNDLRQNMNSVDKLAERAGLEGEAAEFVKDNLKMMSLCMGEVERLVGYFEEEKSTEDEDDIANERYEWQEMTAELQENVEDFVKARDNVFSSVIWSIANRNAKDIVDLESRVRALPESAFVERKFALELLGEAKRFSVGSQKNLDSKSLKDALDKNDVVEARLDAIRDQIGRGWKRVPFEQRPKQNRQD